MKFTAKQLAITLIDLVETKNIDIQKAADGFIHWLNERHELKRIDEVIRAVDMIWTERHGAATLTIETAHPLSANLRKQLTQLAKGAELREAIDPELIGGARLRIDDRVIDGSIAGTIQSLKLTLLSG